MIQLQDYIITVKNVLSNKECDNIVNEYKNDLSFTDGLVGKSNEINEVRRVKELSMSNPITIEINKENRTCIENNLYNACKLATQTFLNIYPYFHVSKDSGFTLLKYEKTDGYGQHVDHDYSEVTRILSLSILLNDDFDGGDWQFFDKEYNVKLSKGDAIIFPSNACFPHAVQNISRGTRYSMVTWFS